jgi:hypothetical protein
MVGRRLYHLDGWASDLAAHIDMLDPGYFGHIVRLSPGFRQVAFAVMAATAPSDLPGTSDKADHSVADDVPNILKEMAQAIRTQSPRRLLIKAFGSCPDGFLGALAKIGPMAQPKQFYWRLHDLFCAPDKRQMADVARQFRRFDAVKLEILAALDPLFLVPRFAEQVASVQEAMDLTEALSVIRNSCSRATDESLDTSIRHHRGSISKWIKRWLSAADRIPFSPHDLGHEFVPLDTARKMADAGRRYENCLRSSTMIIRVLRGMTRFWEMPRCGVIVEAQATGPATGWCWAAIHMPRNGFPSFETAGEVENHFLGAGFGSLNWEPQAPSWDSLSRLTRHGTNLAEIEEIDAALEDLADGAAMAA